MAITLTTHHFFPYLIISYHIISYYHSFPYHIISYHIISCLSISYHIISYQIISHHIISYHIISPLSISYHSLLRHTILCLVIPYHLPFSYRYSHSLSVSIVMPPKTVLYMKNILPPFCRHSLRRKLLTQKGRKN